MPIAVRLANGDDLGAIAAMLARAFTTDPVARFIFPDDVSREDRLRYFFRVQLRHNYLRRGRIYTTTHHSGAAMWIAPHAPTPTPGDLLAQVPLYLWSVLFSRAVIQLGKLLAAHHPRGDHYYLGTIGTEPTEQSRGVGTALMLAVLRECDEKQIPAYLECSSLANVRFYSGVGFVVRDELALPHGGPPIWLMSRAPRAIEG